MTPLKPHSLLVVVPTYDEADNILTLLDRVLVALPTSDVLVVDDGSPDGTGDLVSRRAELDRRIHLLRRDDKSGLGAAYRAGFSWAASRGYRAVVQMDADLSHPPERLPAIVAALDHADVIIGSRYVSGGIVRNWPWPRRLMSRLGNLYVRRVLSLPVEDATGGFKGFRLPALIATGALTSRSSGYCFQIETTWRAVGLGLRVVEVPIEFVNRTKGVSKMSPGILVEAVLRVLIWRARDDRRRWQQAKHHKDGAWTAEIRTGAVAHKQGTACSQAQPSRLPDCSSWSLDSATTEEIHVSRRGDGGNRWEPGHADAAVHGDEVGQQAGAIVRDPSTLDAPDLSNARSRRRERGLVGRLAAAWLLGGGVGGHVLVTGGAVGLDHGQTGGSPRGRSPGANSHRHGDDGEEPQQGQRT